MLDDVLDCTAEIRYSMAFNRLPLKVKFASPGAEAMPDLLVSNGEHSAYVEIKRIRPDSRFLPVSRLHNGGDDLSDDVLHQYGGEEDVRKVEQELRDKFRQVRAMKGSKSILATWSDREFVEEVDFEQAVINIRQSSVDPDDGRPIPDGLVFCVFASFWQVCGTSQ